MIVARSLAREEFPDVECRSLIKTCSLLSVLLIFPPGDGMSILRPGVVNEFLRPGH